MNDIPDSQLQTDLATITLAARRCHPMMERGGRITFQEKVDLPADWKLWAQTLWLPVLQPYLVESLRMARAGLAREMIAAESLLEASLPAAASFRSQREARLLRSSMHPPKGEKLLTRLWETPGAGHFATLFAGRCAAFHLSNHTALTSYLLLEIHPLPLSGIRPSELISTATVEPTSHSQTDHLLQSLG